MSLATASADNPRTLRHTQDAENVVTVTDQAEYLDMTTTKGFCDVTDEQSEQSERSETADTAAARRGAPRPGAAPSPPSSTAGSASGADAAP